MVYQVKHLARGKPVQLSEVFIESEIYLQAQVSARGQPTVKEIAELRKTAERNAKRKDQ